ncbi:hypothetical protein HZS_7840 [Henneguya salminicola]|nr:hypothetical protein HZS_7840 [Henneguya salminicola]
MIITISIYIVSITSCVFLNTLKNTDEDDQTRFIGVEVIHLSDRIFTSIVIAYLAQVRQKFLI